MSAIARTGRRWAGLHRFFLDSSQISDGQVRLDRYAAYQVARVLRHRPGQQVVVLDNTSNQHLVELVKVHTSETTGRVLESAPSTGEPRVAVTLYQALLKSQKFEIALQKGVELGVSRFVPVTCERSIVAVRDHGRERTKLERWRRIILEAAEQSERGRLPGLSDPSPFRDACGSASGPAVILWEHESRTGLERGLRELRERHGGLNSLAVFVGPEGGYTESEVEYAETKDIIPVSLGPRVLRAETAGMAAVAAAMFHLGEWDS